MRGGLTEEENGDDAGERCRISKNIAEVCAEKKNAAFAQSKAGELCMTQQLRLQQP